MKAVFWFRRDLRLNDNTGLTKALQSGFEVLPLFIFDSNILDELPGDDARVSFIWRTLKEIDLQLKEYGSSLLVKQGDPLAVWKALIENTDIEEVYCNKDYEPYSIDRDQKVNDLLAGKGISFHAFKDQVIFEENEVLKPDGGVYTVYTPYKNRWLEQFNSKGLPAGNEADTDRFYCFESNFPSLEAIGFQESEIEVKTYDLSQLDRYEKNRDFPAIDGTSYLSVHLRFGTVSIREIVRRVHKQYPAFLNELIWREFFMQILFHYPQVVNKNFRSKYDGIAWRNNETDFHRWCRGNTGYPMVDAGMRQLNKTGYMHNRVRMVVASFLCKHLLIDWRWGEAYFAKMLLDYELSSNNGNWQWAAGTGCDAAPYFRVFNPAEQQKKFDPQRKYIKKWIPELETFNYPDPMVDHKFARERALSVYKKGIID